MQIKMKEKRKIVRKKLNLKRRQKSGNNKKNKFVNAAAIFIVLAALCSVVSFSASDNFQRFRNNNVSPGTDNTSYATEEGITALDAETITEIEVSENKTTAVATTTKESRTASGDVIVKTPKSKPQTTAATKQPKATGLREKQIRNIYVTASGSKMSDEKVSYLMSIIEGLPNNFFTWNVKHIKVVDSIPGYGKNCRGMSVYAENTIYINSNISSNSMLRSSVYHEFGHYADVSSTGFTLRDCYTRHDEWRNVSSAEMSRLYSYYPGMSSLSDDNKNMEAFAMVFDAYYSGCITGEKVDIKSLCPEMYNTVSNFCN